jgi:two-component system sensor histidine kinase YesM
MKPQSTREKLILPTSLAFVVMIAAMVVSAYVLYSKNVTSSTNDQTYATSQQVLNNYETYFDSVITVSNNVLSTYANDDAAADGDTVKLAKDMRSYFDSVKSLKSEIMEIAIYKASDGICIASDTASNVVDSAAPSTSWFSDAAGNRLINIFTVENRQTYGAQYSFTLSRYISYDKANAWDAVLRVGFDFAKIVDVISPTTLGEGGRIIIYNKDYEAVYTSNQAFTDKEKLLLKGLVVGAMQTNFDSHHFYVYAATITNTTWRVAIFTNQDALSAAITNFTLIICVVGIVVVAAFIGVLYVVANSITRPIKQLQSEMAEIESLNYETSLHPEIAGTSEVVELNKSFNQMMGRIKELTSSVVSEKEEQRKSELKALQNQINPHFLYNTLDSIIAMIDKGESAKAEDMIVALSKFFRISISKGQNIIPLPNEIEHARNYLLIQKMRFGDSFTYDIQVEPGLEKYFVVKLILQPIVENSIGHGLKEGEQGHILIRAYTEGELIKFEIKDNGYGMLPEKVEELRKSLDDDTVYQGVGLKNVYQRIRIYYGDKADVQIVSEADMGTSITIIIPKEGALKNEE